MNLQNIIATRSFQTIGGQPLAPRIVGDQVILDDPRTEQMFDWMSAEDFAYVVSVGTLEESGTLLTITW